jgi:AraC family transcriptional regulator, ethanolamine operon transcriptional activator
MHSHADEPLSMLQLCHLLGTSRRQLNYAFRERLDTSPVKYWTALRLARVRRELTQGHTTVAQAASRWGFWHLGQFARDYRLQFGELPSKTLKGC